MKYYKIMFAYKGANIKERIQDADSTVGWTLSKQKDWGILIVPEEDDAINKTGEHLQGTERRSFPSCRDKSNSEGRSDRQPEEQRDRELQQSQDLGDSKEGQEK